MNTIDSSLWLEYFADTEAGNIVSEIIENLNELIVPTITIYEVFKKLLFETSEYDALFAIAHMRLGEVVELSDELALSAAKISKDHKLPMADSIIYATAELYDAQIYTQDKHFENLDRVHYFSK
jgi:predicted nucleic acid-binding protein